VRSELAGSLPIGVARMVEFARAVADPPQLLLLDEPASGLDETEVARLGGEIQAVRAEAGCAVLLVEHNAGFVMDQSDRVIVLNLGQVLAEGSPADVQRNQAVRDAYLGESDTTADDAPDPATPDAAAPDAATPDATGDGAEEPG
jgi:ABC-type branched-subunit amino acid transport system ATPase component